MSSNLSDNSSCNILGGPNFWIKAEKYGSSGTSRGDRAGIHVTRPLNIHDEAESATMSCSECGEILMKDLIKTLTDHTPDYHLLSRNCWDYAGDTYNKLRKLFK
jgi:hypothetical protein